MRRATTVHDVMTTALMTVRPDESIESADFQMKMTDVRHLPVVGPGNHLVGLVSERDLLRAGNGPASRPVSAIMSQELHTVSPADPALRALDLLLIHRIGCVPVVGNTGELLGIVTDTDFLRLARGSLVH